MFLDLFLSFLSTSALQKLTLHLRDRYISCTKSYSLTDTSDYLKGHDIYKGFPDWLEEELEVFADAHFQKPAKNLYLITFDEVLTTDQAEARLKQLGLLPADISETFLFIKKFKEVVDKGMPIVSLKAYQDYSHALKKRLELFNKPHYGFCLHYTQSGFTVPGDIEADEITQNVAFSRSVRFLAKSILMPLNNNYKTADEFTTLIQQGIKERFKGDV